MAAPDPRRSLRATNLRSQLVDDLRRRLIASEWAEGEQLPTETELAAEYGVSRATVRSALQRLEAQGLTITRHGIGTFVSPYHAIKAGLQELHSITETVRAHGKEPGVEYHAAVFRGATDEEAEVLTIEPGTRVLATERLILADGEAVAFSYEVTPGDALPENLRADQVSGSLFALLDRAGNSARTAVTEVHAATGPEIGWGERDPDQVYVYLRQVHYDANARPVSYARTYFHEGRFQFTILRVR